MDLINRDVKAEVRSVDFQSGSRGLIRACLVTVTAKGKRHIAKGEQNQDAVQVLIQEQVPFSTLMVVADGLGSCRFSDIGSRVAVQTTVDQRDLLRDVLHNKTTFQDASRRLSDAWLRKLSDSLGPVPIAEYDTTLLFAYLEGDELIFGQLGDGLIQWRVNGEDAEELFVRDHDFVNRTSSLCGDQPWMFRRVHLGCFNKLSIIITTDGIADDLKPEHRRMLTELLTNEVHLNGPENAASTIEEWVRDWPTHGHSDDRTLAFLTVWHGGGEFVEG